jgi:hypothetical protein
MMSLVPGCSGAGGRSSSGASSSLLAADVKIERRELSNASRVFTPQRRGDWCWAACAEMALKYNGIDDITQEQLVEKVKGKASDQTAIDTEIIVALATEPKERTQNSAAMPQRVNLDLNAPLNAAIKAATIYSSSDSAVEDFSQGHPVLFGLKDWEGAPAHIVFITAIEYRDLRRESETAPGLKGLAGSFGRMADSLIGSYRYEIRAIEFYDPMPETGGPTRLEGADIEKHFRFYLSRKKAMEIMQSAESTVKLR